MSPQDPVSLDILNRVMEALSGVAVSAQVQGNISTSQMKKMSDDLPQLYNLRNVGELIDFLRKYGKKHPIAFSACDLMIYQLNS